ncbi:succinoglycan biosynthesis protein exop, partial [Salmonella enterica subsp. enterica]|nr:succinoglycan biosynthesis protein exop [Salmonella enterica subsp. enterica]
EKYRAENDLVGAQGRLISEDEIFKLNDQLAAARARTIELNARAESARNMSVDAVVGGAIPEVAASSIISELRAQYAAAKQEMDRLAVRIGPRHPAYQSAQAQVSALQNQISAELKRVSASVQTELKRSVQLEQDLAARLAQLKVRQGDVSSEMVTLRDLERDAQAKRSVYEAYLLRANETSEQQQINSANVSIISEATPPIKPAGISRVIIAAAGAFLGLMSGIGFGAMRGAYGSLQDTAGGWRTGSGAPAGEPAPRGPAAARRPEDEFDDIEDDSMNPYYPPHGYAPYPQPHGQAQQPA